MTFDPIEERDATIAAMRADKAEFARWRDKWVADMQALETRLARSEDATESAEVEVERLRKGIRALADKGYAGTHASINSAWRADLAALLAPSPAATTGEAVCCGDHDEDGGRPCNGCPERAPVSSGEAGKGEAGGFDE